MDGQQGRSVREARPFAEVVRADLYRRQLVTDAVVLAESLSRAHRHQVGYGHQGGVETAVTLVAGRFGAVALSHRRRAVGDRSVRGRSRQRLGAQTRRVYVRGNSRLLPAVFLVLPDYPRASM